MFGNNTVAIVGIWQINYNDPCWKGLDNGYKNEARWDLWDGLAGDRAEWGWFVAGFHWLNFI